MKIAILGTRGIPNRYGGFEQFAEYLSTGLVNMGYEVSVYNPHFHEYKEPAFNGVSIISKWCPERHLGSAAHFLYDYLCLRDAINREFDVVLELGYGSAALSYLLCPINKTRIITNMDGLEWARDKWSPFVKKIMLWFERIGATKSHCLIADNPGIQKHLRESYGKESEMIPYGADVFSQPDKSILKDFKLQENEYYLVIARLEPENNIRMIIDGFRRSATTYPLLIVGDHSNKYGSELEIEFHSTRIRFLGSIYDVNILNNLRYHSNLYIHGHSVGGTNPSLLEAMAAQASIVAHDNGFNRAVLGEDALYFNNAGDIVACLQQHPPEATRKRMMIEKNVNKIRDLYDWRKIVQQYAELIENVAGR